MKIVICGSLTFAQKMIDIKNNLEKHGHFVILPENVESYADGTIAIENKKEKMMLDVIRKYYKKIKEADAVLVLNETKNGIENYIGGNSLIEMAFGHVLNKNIFLFNPLPEISYRDEIEAMVPVILNGDLSLIK